MVDAALELKCCYKCGANKPRADFLACKSAQRASAKAAWCYSCRSEYKLAEYRRNREQYLKTSRLRNQRIASDAELVEIKRQQNRKWKQENKGKVNAATRRRQLAKKMRTPSWVNHFELQAVYVSCPEGYHVDHIIPINGINVSGLHVPWNLQYLPALENTKKSNKVLIDSAM